MRSDTLLPDAQSLGCECVQFHAGWITLPAPATYDHAILREYFGKSKKQVDDAFGKPSSVNHADSQSPPENATVEEQEKFKQATESMTHTCSTPDGDLVFHFKLNDQVFAIRYAGATVSPPEAGEVVITNPADLDKHVGKNVVIRGKLERSKLPSILGVDLYYYLVDVSEDEPVTVTLVE